jgi:hypothetical protein
MQEGRQIRRSTRPKTRLLLQEAPTVEQVEKKMADASVSTPAQPKKEKAPKEKAPKADKPKQQQGERRGAAAQGECACGSNCIEQSLS